MRDPKERLRDILDAVDRISADLHYRSVASPAPGVCSFLKKALRCREGIRRIDRRGG